MKPSKHFRMTDEERARWIGSLWGLTVAVSVMAAILCLYLAFTGYPAPF